MSSLRTVRPPKARTVSLAPDQMSTNPGQVRVPLNFRKPIVPGIEQSSLLAVKSETLYYSCLMLILLIFTAAQESLF